MDGALALEDRSLGIVLRLLDVLLNEPHAFDQHLLLLRQDLNDLARGADMVAGDHLDLIALFDMKFIASHDLENLRRQ